MDFAIQADHKVKIKDGVKIEKYLDLGREQKTVEHESDGDTNWSWCARNNPQKPGKRLEELEIGGRIKTIQTTNNIVKISKNIQQSSGDLKRLAVPQILEKDHQLTLVGKTHK